QDRLFTAILAVAVLVSIAAIYIYIAQQLDLPEPPRSRLGTSGGAQAVRFTYDFHRATGTFREPGLLASWLIVPFFICLTMRGAIPTVSAALIGGTLLLTGSLAAIVGVGIGLGVAALTGVRAGKGHLRTMVAATLVLLLALLIFDLVAVSNTS